MEEFSHGIEEQYIPEKIKTAEVSELPLYLHFEQITTFERECHNMRKLNLDCRKLKISYSIIYCPQYYVISIFY